MHDRDYELRESNRRAAEDALRRLEVQERNEAALAKLGPVEPDCGGDCPCLQHEAAAARLELELHRERRIVRLAVAVLRDIAETDYRGHESYETTRARNALEDIALLRKRDGSTEGSE